MSPFLTLFTLLSIMGRRNETHQWKLGIILSRDGFEGIQFIHADPDIQAKLLALLPQTHKLIQELGEIVKTLTGDEVYGRIS